jgi:hypothetical protein
VPRLLACEALEINSREPTYGGQTPRSIIHEVSINGFARVCDCTGGVDVRPKVGGGDLLDTLTASSLPKSAAPST